MAVAVTYCDWSDLPIQECQHCKDGKKVTGAPKSQHWSNETDTYSGPSRIFQAKFPGKCGACGQTIYEGQDIYMANGAPHHAGE